MLWVCLLRRVEGCSTSWQVTNGRTLCILEISETFVIWYLIHNWYDLLVFKVLSCDTVMLLREVRVEMLYYITMCQLTILYSFRLRLASHLYSVDSPVRFLSSSIIIGSLISDFIRLCALSRLRRCHFRSDFQSRSRTHHWSPSRCGTDGLNFSPPAHPPSG